MENNGTINVCNIIFDTKFKVFINKMKNHFIEDLVFSKNCRTYYLLSSTQEKYREYIVNHKHEITFIDSEKCSNPEYFAILVSLIFPDINIIKKFGDVFENYKTDFTVMDNSLFNSDELDEIDELHCACCHMVSSKNIFYLMNNTTKYTLLIGCDCILKHKILSIVELKELRSKRQFKQKRNLLENCYFCGRKGKCKACINGKLTKNIFKEWYELSTKWAFDKKQLPSKINMVEKKRLSRVMKPLVAQIRQKLKIQNAIRSIQRIQLMVILKPLVREWKKKQPHKCSKCRSILKTDNYEKCYSCFMNERHKCESCDKIINKDYSKCYECKFKYKCKKCGCNIPSDKYKICFGCNRKHKYCG